MWQVPRDETEQSKDESIEKLIEYVLASLTPRRSSNNFSADSVSHTRIKVPFSDAVAKRFPSELIASATTLLIFKLPQKLTAFH